MAQKLGRVKRRVSMRNSIIQSKDLVRKSKQANDSQVENETPKLGDQAYFSPSKSGKYRQSGANDDKYVNTTIQK